MVPDLVLPVATVLHFLAEPGFGRFLIVDSVNCKDGLLSEFTLTD